MTQHKCTHVVVGFAKKIYLQQKSVGNNQYKKDVGMLSGMHDLCNIDLIGTGEGIYASPMS